MSKQQEEKVIIPFEREPILADLGFPDLVKEFHRLHLEEKDAEIKAQNWRNKRLAVSGEIQAAIETVHADSVDYDSGRRQFRATLVKGDPSKKLNEDRLRENLMKLGKLDAALLKKIFDASQDDVPAKKPYVLVTVRE